MSGLSREPVYNKVSHHKVLAPIKIIANDIAAASGNFRQFFKAIPAKTITGNMTV